MEKYTGEEQLSMRNFANLICFIVADCLKMVLKIGEDYCLWRMKKDTRKRFYSVVQFVWLNYPFDAMMKNDKGELC